jgi:hypothetical protein
MVIVEEISFENIAVPTPSVSLVSIASLFQHKAFGDDNVNDQWERDQRRAYRFDQQTAKSGYHP